MTNGPRLTLFRSEVRDNCGSNGGGVRIHGGTDHLILLSTVAGNGAATRAGGLYIQNGGGRIEDSTIAENSGPEAGGILISGEKQSKQIAPRSSATLASARVLARRERAVSAPPIALR